LEQLVVINTSTGTSHIYNLNKGQSQNQSPVIKSADYECGGFNSTKVNFFAQQLQQMKVKNVEAVIRFKYAEASEQGREVPDGQDQSSYQDKSEGIGTLLNKAAAGAGIIS
jgi:hypothetical protein